ncbi:MAG: hypothetical protein WDN28_23765 [Chthoniobacter sp.]
MTAPRFSTGQGAEATVEFATVDKGKVTLKKISAAKSRPPFL